MSEKTTGREALNIFYFITQPRDAPFLGPGSHCGNATAGKGNNSDNTDRLAQSIRRVPRFSVSLDAGDGMGCAPIRNWTLTPPWLVSFITSKSGRTMETSGSINRLWGLLLAMLLAGCATSQTQTFYFAAADEAELNPTVKFYRVKVETHAFNKTTQYGPAITTLRPCARCLAPWTPPRARL